jgi:hypothetical protein
MATAADLLADLNDRIDDAANTQISQETKLRYLSHGIRAMWPRVYRTVVDTSIVLASEQYEYVIPSIVGDHAMITRVDIETNIGTSRWMPLNDIEVLPLQTTKVLVLDYKPSYIGSRIRVVSAKRLAAVYGPADMFEGPPGTEEIPVWYALGLVMSRKHEDRLDHTRLSTVLTENGVDIPEVINSAQFCFAQFDLLLDQYEMPLPSRVG